MDEDIGVSEDDERDIGAGFHKRTLGLYDAAAGLPDLDVGLAFEKLRSVVLIVIEQEVEFVFDSEDFARICYGSAERPQERLDIGGFIAGSDADGDSHHARSFSMRLAAR